MRRRALVVLALAVLALWAQSTVAEGGKTFSEQDFEVVLGFFSGGGTWTFRLAPPTAPEKETTWKVLVLRPSGSTKTSFQLGATELGPKSTIASAQKVLDLYSADRATIVEFLRRYADRIDKTGFEAQLVAMPPVKQGARVPIKAAVRLTKQGLLDLLK
ncbi:MAG: hypothetical protein LAO31_03840 [Acidobacteriia bacterium]|nr:hypothetical protein [Terriglobia bacterium]